MSKDGIDMGSIVMLGALAIGGYVTLKYILPLMKDLGGVAEAVGATAGAVTGAVNALNQPIIPTAPGMAPAPTPINYGIPITGIPGFIKFIQQPIYTPPVTAPAAIKSTPLPSYGAFLFPPLGVLDLIPAVQKALGPAAPIMPSTKVPLTKMTAPAQYLPQTKITLPGGQVHHIF